MKKICLCCFVFICLFAFRPYSIAASNEEPSIADNQVVVLNDDGVEVAVGSSNFFCSTFGPEVQFPRQLATIVHMVIIVMQLLVPILLVIFGSIDFVKAVSSQKEDEIKKGQQVFLKRLIAGALVFFVVAIVKLIISMFGSANSDGNLMSCVNCFVKGVNENQYQC